jgi:hypothetical protein
MKDGSRPTWLVGFAKAVARIGNSKCSIGLSRELDHFEFIRSIGIGDEIGGRIGLLRSGG